MRILITGTTGFVGGHLAEALAARGDVVMHGLSRSGTWPPELAHLADKMPLHAIDMADRERIARLLAEVRPEWIFHLAGYAHAGRSYDEPEQARLGNLGTTRQLYEAIVRWGGSPRTLFVSSSLVYGEFEGVCDETFPVQPDSPYAASKAAAEEASRQFASEGLDIVIARPFNHIGPRQSPDYAIPRFASQIAAIERGRQPPILETGDLSAWRDLSDVRDTVRAYILLLEKGRRGEAYNIGSGVAYEISDVLNRLLALSDAKIEIRSRPDARPPDAAILRADTAKLRRETGWEPTISLDQTLRDTLDYWRVVSG